METLFISVEDTAKANDFVVEVFAVLRRIISFVASQLPEKPKKPKVEKPQTNSPPDLGVSVGETAKVEDRPHQ